MRIPAMRINIQHLDSTTPVAHLFPENAAEESQLREIQKKAGTAAVFIENATPWGQRYLELGLDACHSFQHQP